MSKVKGAVVREFVKWYAQRAPAGTLERAVREMPPDVQRHLDPRDEALGILTSSWYDSRIVHALLDAVQRTVPASEWHALLRDGTRAGIHATASGVYRWIVRKLTPELYARNIQRLWSMMHDTGVREIRMTSRTTAISTTRDWAGHHPALCVSTSEAMAALLEVMGAKDVAVERVECVSEGHPACVTHVSWRDR